MTSSDGRSFTLAGFDGAETYVNIEAAAAHENHYLVAATIRLTGTKADGTVLQASFALDGLNDGGGSMADFETFVLPSDWTNLISVKFDGFTGDGLPGGFSIDNINTVQDTSTVAVSGRQLLVNGYPYLVKGVVYEPVPTGADPRTASPFGDYFTQAYRAIYSRDIPLLRQMGANTIRLEKWDNTANHADFLDMAYNGGVDPMHVIAGYVISSGLDIDPTSVSNVREQIKSDFRQMVALHKGHPAILMWSIGSDLNAVGMYGNSKDNLFSLINEMAAEAHAEEGAGYHPVAVSLADVDLKSTIAAYDTSVPALDLWGVSIYRGNTFGSLFSDHGAVSNKPLVILGYGIDAYDNRQSAEYELSGSAFQADYAGALWNEIAENSAVCVGGTLVEYSDEWWKGALSADPNCTETDPAAHGPCGHVSSAEPDGYANDEWWGIMRTVAGGTNQDVMVPRSVYQQLKSLWVPPVLTLSINSGELYAHAQNVGLSVSCNDIARCSWMDQQQYSNDNIAWSSPSALMLPAPWALTAGDGLKTVYARFRDIQGTWSNPVSASAFLDATAPVTTASPAGGTYTTGQAVILNCGDSMGSGCERTYYTTDGTMPTTASAVYSGTIMISATSTLRFFSVDNAGNAEAVRTQIYSINPDTTVPATTATPAGGSYTTAQTVMLTCNDGGSGCDKTYYTTDGSTPTTASNIYAAPIVISSTTTLKYLSTDIAGNTESVKTQTYTMDTVAPTGTILISGGAEYTRSQTITLNLTCSDDVGCTQMKFSNDNATWGSPVAYAATRSWTMTSGSGEKTVYARFADSSGNWSAVENDTIILDNTSPLTTASPAGGSYTTSKTVTLTCSDAGSGCDKTYYTIDGTTPTTASNVYTTPIIISSTTTLKYLSRDLAGNTEGVRTQTYTLDTTPPTGTILINSGSAYTRSRTVTLAFSCSDDRSCYQLQLSNDNITWGSPGGYVASRTWSLTAGDGEKTVYVKFRDAAGNWSDVFSDMVTLDTVAPLTSASPAGGSYTTAQTVMLTCNDGGSGCDKTYYTTDGSTPTTASNIYAAPIMISSTTTLKYLSTDIAGNTESVKTQTYTVNY